MRGVAHEAAGDPLPLPGLGGVDVNTERIDSLHGIKCYSAKRRSENGTQHRRGAHLGLQCPAQAATATGKAPPLQHSTRQKALLMRAQATAAAAALAG